MVGLAQLSFAASVGAATFLSPCSFPLLPGYLAVYLGDDLEERSTRMRLGRAIGVAAVVSLGFLTVFALLGAIVVTVGASYLQDIAQLELFVGSLLVVLGVALLAGWTPSAAHIQLPERERSLSGFYGFGLLYALAAASCTAPVFIGVAGLAVGSGPVGGAAIIGAYAGGMSALMVGVTVSAALGKEQVLRRLGRETGRIYRVAGALLILAGLDQIHFYVYGTSVSRQAALPLLRALGFA